jgi:NAD(P)-dependent dehydrogenase (short-subunit alcohol dehydrogenase family)
VAVITGSTSDIGARTAELFVAEGARVVIAGPREETGRQLARALGRAASVDGGISADCPAAATRDDRALFLGRFRPPRVNRSAT